MRNPLQLVLDFLSPPPEPAPTSVRKARPTVSTLPLSPLSQSQGEVAIAHPRANRETVLEWVLRKWAELQEKQKNIRQIEWREGASLDYLGAPIHLQLSPQNGRSELNDQRQLLLALPHSAEASQIRDAVQAWLMREAKTLFERRLNHFAPLMGVQWRRLSLSNAGSRWGSARVDGAIRLNWRLIHLKPEAIDYVVVHELAHLHEMNHSPAFWKVVSDILPDHHERRKALQKENLANWA